MDGQKGRARNLHVWRVGMGAVALFSMLVKFFTVEIRLMDDPSVAIGLRMRPSLSNQIILARWQDDFPLLVGFDESYVGESIYAGFVSYGWWILLILCLFGVLQRGSRS